MNICRKICNWGTDEDGDKGASDTPTSPLNWGQIFTPLLPQNIIHIRPNRAGTSVQVPVIMGKNVIPNSEPARWRFFANPARWSLIKTSGNYPRTNERIGVCLSLSKLRASSNASQTGSKAQPNKSPKNNT